MSGSRRATRSPSRRHVTVHWAYEPSAAERSEVERWLRAHGHRHAAYLGIGRSIVTAFAGAPAREWGTFEHRGHHADLASALTGVIAAACSTSGSFRVVRCLRSVRSG